MATEPPPPPNPPSADPASELDTLKELVAKQEAEILALREKYEPKSSKFNKAAGTYESSDEIPAWVEALEGNIEGSPVDERWVHLSRRGRNNINLTTRPHAASRLTTIEAQTDSRVSTTCTLQFRLC